MNTEELLKTIANGEDSRQQFKETISRTDSLAAELVAFTNTSGGRLFIGVDDHGQVKGLSKDEVRQTNELISNAASQHIRPPINPTTYNVHTEQGVVVVVEVETGANKPYMDAQGRIWVKSGADKRHVTAREEMQRMFQQSGLIYADEMPVKGTTISDLDEEAFAKYFEKRYNKTIGAAGVDLETLLHNLNLAHQGRPTLTGMLLFGRDPRKHLPSFGIKAFAYPGLELHDISFRDGKDIHGTLHQQYEQCMDFIDRNLHHVPSGPSFNSQSRLEIPEIVFEELIVNAMVHRDYFQQAPIRILLFGDRIEIISPGHLPNHLDTQQIRYGLTNLRNPALASHAYHILPYKGLGSGIPRVVAAWPRHELIDDRAGQQFKVILERPEEYAVIWPGLKRPE